MKSEEESEEKEGKRVVWRTEVGWVEGVMDGRCIYKGPKLPEGFSKDLPPPEYTPSEFA